MTECKNSHCDKAQSLSYDKTKIATKLKRSNSKKPQRKNCDKTQTQIVTKVKNSNSDNSHSDKA